MKPSLAMVSFVSYATIQHSGFGAMSQSPAPTEKRTRAVTLNWCGIQRFRALQDQAAMPPWSVKDPI